MLSLQLGPCHFVWYDRFAFSLHKDRMNAVWIAKGRCMSDWFWGQTNFKLDDVEPFHAKRWPKCGNDWLDFSASWGRVILDMCASDAMHSNTNANTNTNTNWISQEVGGRVILDMCMGCNAYNCQDCFRGFQIGLDLVWGWAGKESQECLAV